jgi:hypothetical protein
MLDPNEPVTTDPSQPAEDPKPAEPVVAAAPAPVPDDHPTKLGRRVKQMEEHLDLVLDRLEALASQQIAPPQAAPQSFNDPELDDPELRRLEERLERRRMEKEQKQLSMSQRYVQDYLRVVNRGSGGDVDEELHEAVVKELTEVNPGSYPKHTGDAGRDGKINYELALAKLLRQQRVAAKNRPNVQGDKRNAPLDLSSTSRLGDVPVKKIELDEFAKKFVRSLGLAEDDPWVQESLQKL